MEIQHVLLNSVWSDGLAPGGTDYKSSHTCVQHCDIRSASQRWRTLPNPGRAGGRVGSDRQTLLSGIDKTRRQAAGPFFDDTLSSYILRHLSKLLRLFGDAADTRLPLKSTRGKLGGKWLPARLWSGQPQIGQGFLTWKSCHRTGQAGSRTTLQTKIARGGKHEISCHLL